MRAQRPLQVLTLFLLALSGSAVATAQTSSQAHPGEYAPADIAYGSRLYDAQCTTCHGANGDGVGGVDLRSGKFRNAVTDQDLIRVITNGIQGTGMQAFKLDPSEIAGILAISQKNTSGGTPSRTCPTCSKWALRAWICCESVCMSRKRRSNGLPGKIASTPAAL